MYPKTRASVRRAGDVARRAFRYLKKLSARHAAFAVFAALFVITSLFSYNTFVYAATYNFTQSSWAGGADAVSVATHPTNESNWTKFATSTNVVAGSTVQLAPTSYIFTDDGATSTSPTAAAFGGGFGNGTNASTTVSGSGTGASVALTSSLVPKTTVLGSYAVSSAGAGITFDSSTNSIWVTNGGTNNVTKINPTTGATIGTYAVGAGPFAIAFDPSTNSIWTANFGGGTGTTVTKISAATGALIGTYTVGTGPYAIAFDPSTNSIWTANYGTSNVTKLSAATGALIGTYAAAGTTYANGIAFDSSTNSMWVANRGGGATKFSAATGAVIGTYTTSGTSPISVAFDSSTNSVWVTNFGSNNVSKLGASTGALTGIYAVGSLPFGVAFDPVTNTIWVTNNGTSNVTNLSAATGAVIGTYTVGSGPDGVTFDSYTNSIWTENYSSSNVTKISVVSQAYASSGTFTSAPINLGAASPLSTLAYTKTTSASTSLTMDIRAGNTPTPDGSWSAWQTGVASGGSIAALGSAQYVQYRASLATTDTGFTPSLNSVTIGYSQYGSGTLTSSIYDSGDPTNLVTNMRWTATGTSTTETVKFQVRSASTTAGIASAAWCGPADTSAPCSGTSYFTDSTGGTALSANNPLRSGGDDRYFQYKAFLSSGGAATPVLTQAVVQYVVNAPPQFDPTYGTGGTIVAQDATSTDPTYGAVTISYKVRDPDTSTGSVTPGYVTPSFEYNTGSGWISIPSSDLAAGDTANKAVDDSIYNIYTATWFATSTLPNTFASSTQVRVTVNDNEGANNTAQAVSASFALDTKPPVLAATINASAATTTAALTLTATDDSQLQYRLCNDASFPTADAQGNSCAWSALGGNIASSSIAWTPIADAQGDMPVYLQAKDALGNATAETVVAPAVPANFDLKDVSNTAISSYKEFLSWAVFTATTSSSFSSYKLYTSTDGAAYSLLATITDPAVNYYADTITTATTSLHYYKAVVTTTQGNTSAYTATLSDIPNGQGGSDTTPPAISAVAVPSATLKNTSALVTFTTDELAKGTVQYKKVGDSGWTTVASLTYSLSHSIYLEGLAPNTAYNLQVKAEDAAGNVSAYVAGPNFTTVGGPVITNVSETSITDTSATVVWNTSTSSDSYVLYSTSQDLSGATTAGSATYVACVGAVCQHSVSLSSLAPATTYYFSVSSTDGAGNTTADTNAGTYYSFHTTLDVTPPVLSNISTPVISSTAAVVVWQTDKPATSQLMWGTASGALTHTTVLDSTQSVYHVVPLSSATNDTTGSAQTLAADTPYYFKAFSVDAAGNIGSSTEQTFATAKDGQVTIIAGGTPTVSYANASGTGTGAAAQTTPPVISSVTVDNVGAFSAEVHVVADKNVTAFVDYGDSTSYGSTAGDHAFSNTKTITLNNLQEGTTYHYRVTVFDQYGNTATSNDQTFKTLFVSESLDNRTLLEKASDVQGKLEQLIESALPSLAPPFISTPSVSSTTENSATVTWTTNIGTYGSLRYATDAEYLANKNDYVTEVADGQTVSTTHAVTLTNLLPNTLYHVQARSYVFPQVVGKSPDLTFSTKAAPITAAIVAVKNDGFTVVWQTADPTSSVVEYRNLASGESNLITDNTKKTYHNVQIQNLPSGTTYTVAVSGTNGNGNRISAAKTLRVTTTVDVTPPVISNFKVDNALVPGNTGFVQSVVGWMTDKPANSTVYYEEGAGGPAGTSTELANKVSSLDTYTTSHIMILPNLRAGTVYRIKVVSTDQSGNTKVFGPTSIITPNQSQSVLDIIVKNFEDTFKFLGAK